MKKKLPEPGTREWLSVVQDDFREALVKMEDKYGGDLWRYFSVILEGHCPEGDTFACLCHSVGYEKNIINGFVKWMDEIANHKAKEGLVENSVDEMKRILIALHSAVVAPKWEFKIDPIPDQGPKVFIGSSLPDTPPADASH